MSAARSTKISWEYNGKNIKTLQDIPSYDETVGFVYLLTLIDPKTQQEYQYIGKKNLYSVTNPTISKKRYLELKKQGYPVTKKRTKDKKSWNYKLKNVKKESNWASYASSSKVINNSSYKITKKQILYFCGTEFDLKYKEAREIICRGALETPYYLNQGVSLRIYGNM